MSKVSITRSLLDDLAMSISAKSGEAVPMTLTEMKDAVDSIQTGGGGSVTVTDETNATGTTCVITSGGSPTPTSPDIPLNTQLIDFTAVTNDYVVNSSGNVVAEQWYSVSDYTEIDPSMTFSYSGCYWFYIGFYDASKNTISALSMNSDGTQRPNDTNYCDGTLTPAKMPSNAKYVRITSTMNPDSTILSLIRTA